MQGEFRADRGEFRLEDHGFSTQYQYSSGYNLDPQMTIDVNWIKRIESMYNRGVNKGRDWDEARYWVELLL
jgi:hypothetical protein